MKPTTLEGMFHKYYEVQAGLKSARTSMPDPETSSMNVQDKSAQKSRDSLEGRKAFVADVNNYVGRLHWCDKYIIMGRNRPHGEKRVSWSKLVKLLRIMARFRKIEYYYRDYSDMSKRYRNNIRPLAEDYFKEIGYLK